MADEKSCNRQLKKLLTKLRDNCDRVVISLKSGSKCCWQKGCICQVTPQLVTLITGDKNCSRKYIPLDCICAVTVLCEEEDSSKDHNCQHDSRSDSGTNLFEEPEEVNKERQEKEEITPSNDRVYGYGRKIRINFLNQDSELEIEEVTAVELSINVAEQNARNLLQYFHRSQIDRRNLGVSVLPTGPGEITSIEVNETEKEAVITGRGLLYINSQPERETDFELVVTENQASMEFAYQEEQLTFGPNELIGVGSQQPITIQRDK